MPLALTDECHLTYVSDLPSREVNNGRRVRRCRCPRGRGARAGRRVPAALAAGVQPDQRGDSLAAHRRPPLPRARRAGRRLPGDHGLSRAEGINPFTAAGVLADADRDGIDQLVFYPSFGLCAPSLEDRSLALGFARLYNEWIADFCRRGNGRFHGVAVIPVEWVDDAVAILREARKLGLVVRDDPAGAEDAQPRPPRPRPVLRRGRRARHAARRPRRPRHSPAEDRRRPLRQLHPGALRQLPLRPDDGDDRDGLGRSVRPPSQAARRLPRGGRRLGAVLHRSHARALREARRLDRQRLEARAAASTSPPATSG